MDIEHDKALIERLGGPAKVAELLGYEKDGGTQRVHNWTARGIPAKVKLERPDLFPTPATRASQREPADGPCARGDRRSGGQRRSDDRFSEGKGRGGRNDD